MPGEDADDNANFTPDPVRAAKIIAEMRARDVQIVPATGDEVQVELGLARAR